jgi:signal transduction histidine kinase
MSPDGKLWFANGSVLQQIDPLHLPANNILPPVHIEEIVADTREYPLQNNLALPALTRELQINYTALSFAIPQRVQFRYKLDGLENEWQNVGTRRQAFFTNLRPGTYRFHVIACNDDGLWNSVGDTIGFTIAPAYYQTRWFALMCVAASGAILWALYLMRLKQATYQLQERLNARMEERERIARELHDTLLQGFQGLMLRFQAVVKMLPIEAVARQTMEQVLDRADEVLLEGRQSVRDLREEGTSATEMCEALRQCGEELAQNHTASFSLMIVGEPKAMATVVFNESYRIAREALVNAFQHSQGRNVEVEVTYLVSRVSIRVRDDGIGIDADILTKGRKGHWGLSGMRERAQKVAARLDIWSQAGSGTEIELTIPSTVAYPHDKRRSLRQRLYDMFIRFQRSRS